VPATVGGDGDARCDRALRQSVLEVRAPRPVGVVIRSGDPVQCVWIVNLEDGGIALEPHEFDVALHNVELKDGGDDVGCEADRHHRHDALHLDECGTARRVHGPMRHVLPPLLLPSGSSTPTGAVGVTGLGVVSMNGGMQVTVHGDPLYRFSGDKATGDTNGEGINSFGGIWHIGHTTAASGAGTATTTTPAASSGNPYG
jgi:hypothetical protein